MSSKFRWQGSLGLAERSDYHALRAGRIGVRSQPTEISVGTSLGDRFAGEMLDSIVVIVVIFLSALPLAVDTTIGLMTIACGLLYAPFHLLLADSFSNGQSFGKRIMNIAVVDSKTRQPCTRVQSFVRNIFLIAFGAIDWVFIFGPNRQRLGDMIAGTMVIKTGE